MGMHSISKLRQWLLLICHYSQFSLQFFLLLSNNALIVLGPWKMKSGIVQLLYFYTTSWNFYFLSYIYILSSVSLIDIVHLRELQLNEEYGIAEY